VATFKIKIPDFEGPLDLLLFFIKRDELDIYDIPIAHITKEFLRYLHLMQMLDLELAGDFIVMAASLMQIKARMMLPRPPTEEGEDESDPRAELTQQLLEYKRFKETALEMQHLELEQRQKFFRSLFKYDTRKSEPVDEDQVLKDVTMFHLIRAFQNAMTNIPPRTVHEIHDIPYTIEEQGLYIMKFFDNRGSFNFLELLGTMREKIQIIVTFIALLELIRAQRVSVKLYAAFNDFQIMKQDDEQQGNDTV
jgi:segregation and condensation protein A